MIALEKINTPFINRSLWTAGGCPEKNGGVHQATNFVGPGPARRHKNGILWFYESFPVPASEAYEQMEEKK
jgi:hypothetical protein